MAAQTLHAETKSTYSEQRWELVFALMWLIVFAFSRVLADFTPAGLWISALPRKQKSWSARVHVLASVSHLCRIRAPDRDVSGVGCETAQVCAV